MEIISKKEAKDRGLKKYYTGNPCKYGHVAERYISGGCYACSTIKNHSEYTRQYYRDHKEEYSARGKDHYIANTEDYRIRSAKNYQNDIESVKIRHRKYRIDNRELLNEKVKIKKAEDVQFRLKVGLRDRLIKAIRGDFKAGSAVSDLGCTIGFLRDYLESKFTSGMTWENWSRTGWHIDHIKPLALFDLTDREQLLEACHYKNLQPMWALDNLSKGSRFSPII